MWWLTHSLKVGALKLAYGGVTHLTQVVGVVALLTWESGQLIIYGASGELALTLNMVAQVTKLIIRRRGRRENPMLNHLLIVAVDEGRRWHIITLASKGGSIILARHHVVRLQSLVLEWLRSRSRRRTVLKKSRSRLGIINATKRDGDEVKLGSIVLELVGLGHHGGTSLMLAILELGLREVCLRWRSLGLHKFLFRLESTNVVVVEGLVVLEEDSLVIRCILWTSP